MTDRDSLPTETAFRELLAEADSFVGLFGALAADGLPAMVDGDDLPEATLRRLGAWAVLEYRGALTLLARADVAFSAEVMLRALLEYHAHVAWIHDGPKEDTRSPATRAACLELGIATEAVTSLTVQLKDWTGEGLSSAPSDAQVTAAAQKRLQDVQAVHDASGCTCKGRSYGGVRPMLQQLFEDGITWPYGLWVISSSAAHQLLPGRVEVDLGDGTSAFLTYAPYVWRANQLGFVIRAYGLACVRVLNMVNSGAEEGLFEEITRLLEHPTMKAAESEELDRNAMAYMDGLKGSR